MSSKFASSAKHQEAAAAASKAASADVTASLDAPKWYEDAHLTPESSNLKLASAALAATATKASARAARDAAAAAPAPTYVTAEHLKGRAEAALADYITAQSQTTLRRANVRWIDQMLTSGTIADKISALSLQIKNAPYQALRFVDSLLAIAKKQGRRESTLAIDALKDAFHNELLPRNRRLKTFLTQPWAATYAYYTQHPQQTPLPAGHPFLTLPPPALLALWYLEDGIKARYAQFLEVLENGMFDALAHVKRARLNAAYELLCDRPEAEEKLMGMLVNKLGDSDRKVAAKVHFLLSQLLDKNPGMTIAVVKEVERLLFRPHVKPRAQYFALCFMNQLIFRPGDYLLAQALIGIYFSLFKLLAANLIRDGPAVPVKKDKTKDAALDRKQRASDKHNKDKRGATSANKSKVATRIALSSGELKAEDTDAGLSKKMLGALLTGVNRAFPFARNAEAGADVAAVDKVLEEHAAALFDVAATQDAAGGQGYFSVVVQALVLLHQIMLVRESIETRFYSVLYKAIVNPELLTTSKTMLFMNLLFKTMKADSNPARVVAFTKRLLQVALQATPAFACASIFLIYEIGKAQPVIAKATRRVDTLDLSSAATTPATSSSSSKRGGADDEDSGVKTDAASAFITGKVAAKLYDGSEGDPTYARAGATALWELSALVGHYHPSVAMFAAHVVRGEAIVYTGNPLEDFSRNAFLNRFVRRAPKAAPGAGGKHGDEEDALEATFASTKAADRAARRAMTGPASLHRPAAKVLLTAAAATGKKAAAGAKQPSAKAVAAMATADSQFITKYQGERAKTLAAQGVASGGKNTWRKGMSEEEAEDAWVAQEMEKEMLRMSGGSVRKGTALDDDLGGFAPGTFDDIEMEFPDEDGEGDAAGADWGMLGHEGDDGDIFGLRDGGEGDFGDEGDMFAHGEGEDEDDEEVEMDDDDEEEEEEEEGSFKAKRPRPAFTAKGAFDDDDEGEDEDEDDDENPFGAMGSDDSEAEAADSDDDEDEAAALAEMMGKKPAAAKGKKAAAKKGKGKGKGKKGDDSDTDDELGLLLNEAGEQESDGDGSDDEGMFGASTFASAEEFADLLEGSGVNKTAASDARLDVLSKYGYTGKGYGKTIRGKTVVDKSVAKKAGNALKKAARR